MKIFSSKGTALITGASSGIGAIYADRLARQGYDLILVARNETRLKALADNLIDRTGRSVKTVAADLLLRCDMERVEALIRADGRITMLVNNAGVGATAPLVDSDIYKMEDMIALNVTALTRLSYAIAPEFVRRGSGTIINLASIVAIAPELLNGVYGATKAYVLAFTRSLHHELADKGVRVQAVLPGATATAFWDEAGTPIEYLPPDWVMPADEMVDAALAGLAMGEQATLPSLPDAADWDAYEQARDRLVPNLSRRAPASRFFTATSMSA